MKPRFVRVMLEVAGFAPIGPDNLPVSGGEPIYMTYDELEAFCLIYHEGLNQEEAAKRMKVSRGTVWRCLERARKKVACMLVERRPLVITSAPPPPSEERGI